LAKPGFQHQAYLADQVRGIVLLESPGDCGANQNAVTEQDRIVRIDQWRAA